MTLKKSMTFFLLLFVAGSLGWLVASELTSSGPDRSEATQSDLEADPSSQSSQGVTQAKEVMQTATSCRPTLIAYYFHGDVRCVTCKTMEAYASETIEQTFARELASGRLQWKKINVDLPGNRHYVDDFNLYTRSLVLVKMVDGQPEDYRNLEAIWTLVGDKPAYVDYVSENIREMLEGAS